VANLATFFLDVSKQRPAEAATGQWVGGMNLGGSNAPGVGLCTNNPDPKFSDWSNTTFNGAASLPDAMSGHIGLVSVSPADRINAVQTGDSSDTLKLVTATGPTAPGAELISGVINRSDVTIQAGSRIWGVVVVA
jgi:hypothetical protein